MIVGGIRGGQTFLGYVDKIGVAFEDNHVASGYGAHLAIVCISEALSSLAHTFQPLMRSAYEANPNMSEADAVALLNKCMQVLFYRDARSINRVRKDTTVIVV